MAYIPTGAQDTDYIYIRLFSVALLYSLARCAVDPRNLTLDTLVFNVAMCSILAAYKASRSHTMHYIILSLVCKDVFTISMLAIPCIHIWEAMHAVA